MGRRLRAVRPDLKVLYVSAFVDTLFEKRPTLWEGEAFLDKPFTANGLLEAVSLLLRGRLPHGVASTWREVRIEQAHDTVARFLGFLGLVAGNDRRVWTADVEAQHLERRPPTQILSEMMVGRRRAVDFPRPPDLAGPEVHGRRFDRSRVAAPQRAAAGGATRVQQGDAPRVVGVAVVRQERTGTA